MKITEEQKNKLSKIAGKRGLKLVLLFGSFARGKERKDSDLDIAISGNKNLSFKKIIDISTDLAKIFKKDIDISVIDTADPLLLEQIAGNSILIFGKPADFSELKLYAFKRYNDYLPYFKIEALANKNFVKQYAA